MSKIRVECLECGRKFATTSMLPTCPACGGSDIEPEDTCWHGENRSLFYVVVSS